MSDVPTATKIAALEDHVLRLLAENVRLSNEAATERERCGVLEREVRKWRDVNEKAQAVRKVYRQHGGGALVERLKQDAEASLRVCIEETMKETDTRHALDAAKFGKEQNDG